MSSTTSPPAIIVGVAAALLLHDPTPGAPWFTIHLALAMLVVACCRCEDHALAPLLQLPVLAYLGTISHGLYLLHMLCKNFVGKAFAFAGIELGAISCFLATLPLSIAVADLSYRCFESPASCA